MKEIIIAEQKTNSHFSEIAPKYRGLRTTDSGPIEHIMSHLCKKSGIIMTDVY